MGCNMNKGISITIFIAVIVGVIVVAVLIATGKSAPGEINSINREMELAFQSINEKIDSVRNTIAEMDSVMAAKLAKLDDINRQIAELTDQYSQLRTDFHKRDKPPEPGTITSIGDCVEKYTNLLGSYNECIRLEELCHDNVTARDNKISELESLSLVKDDKILKMREMAHLEAEKFSVLSATKEKIEQKWLKSHDRGKLLRFFEGAMITAFTLPFIKKESRLIVGGAGLLFTTGFTFIIK